MAASAFQHLAKLHNLEGWEADFAGIRAHRGQIIAPEVREALAAKGLEPLKIGVQELTPKLVKSSDLLLCMTSDQEDWIDAKFLSARRKLRTLMSVCENPTEVFDPNKLGVEKFSQCLDMMWPALEIIVERLK